MSEYYDQFTFEFLLNRALARVPDTLDKRPGSVIYTALAPACYELAETYMELASILDRTFADTSTGDDLTRRAAERGIERSAATAAVRKGVFNLVVAVGKRFSIEDTTYVVTANFTGFESELTCEQVGSIGNAYSGTLTPIDYIAGLTSAELTSILIPGEDTETDEELRQRYFEDVNSQSFGGNVADYKQRTKALAGVGGVKVYPIWAGGGTVKLVIIDSDYLVPSGALVTAVQTAIDPVSNSGEGLGLAPIGHVVTVEGVTSVTVNVETSVTLSAGYLWADVAPYITEAIESYLEGLRMGWESESAITVRVSQVDAAILTVTGVVDVTATKLNTVAANLVLTANQIPVLGSVTNV